MKFSPVPQYSFRDITDISPDFLSRLGVRFLMLDLDNTIAAYGESSLSGDIARWAAVMKKNRVELFIVSNNRRKGRVEAFAQALEIGFIKAAWKPSPNGVLKAMETARFTAHESALAGDQVFADALAANRAGAFSIVVRPRSFRSPLLAIRYALESPFRAFCKNKHVPIE